MATFKKSVSYKNSSPWANTKQNNLYLELMSIRPIPAENDDFKYGIGAYGKWFERTDNFHRFKYKSKEYKEAKPKEVEEALIKEAKKRGYINGNYECLSNLKTHTVLNKYHLYNNELFHGKELDRCNIIFSHGTWATIINKKKMTISEIEKEYNIEVVKE